MQASTARKAVVKNDMQFNGTGPLNWIFLGTPCVFYYGPTFYADRRILFGVADNKMKQFIKLMKQFIWDY